MQRVRETSRQALLPLGVQIPATLPVLEPGLVLRSVDEAASRLLGMHCVAAVAHGLDRDRAQKWLSSEGLAGSLTPSEYRFLCEDTGQSAQFIWLVEAMWALAWALGKVPRFDLGTPCDERFVTMVPDLRRLEPGVAFRQNLKLRTLAEVVQACDTLYCLHWAIVEAGLRRKRLATSIAHTGVLMRRHALEWLLTTAHWDEVPLDT